MAVETKKWLKFRIVIVLLIFLVLFIALLSRAFQLQILSGQKLKTLAQRQQTTTLQLQPERGVIYDRNGEKLAASIMADSVCADPSKIADPVRTSRQISEILHLDKQCGLQENIGAEKLLLAGQKNFSGAGSLLWKTQILKGLFWSKSRNVFIPMANWRRICLDLSARMPPVWKAWKKSITKFLRESRKNWPGRVMLKAKNCFCA